MGQGEMQEAAVGTVFEVANLPRPTNGGTAWGVAFPLLVIGLDPFLLDRSEGAPIGPISVFLGPTALYFSAASTSFVFLTWHRASSLARNRALRAGWLIGGTILCLLIGLPLFPLATLGLFFMLLGALGYAPLVAAYVYWRSLRAYPHWAMLPREWIAAGTGAHLILVSGLYLGEKGLSDHLGAKLREAITFEQKIPALRNIALYPFALKRFDHLICAEQFPFDQDTTSTEQFTKVFNEGLDTRFGLRAGEMRMAMSAALGQPAPATYCYTVIKRALD